MRWRREPNAPDDGWSSEVSSGFALAGFLFLVFIGFTVLAMTRLASIDTYFNSSGTPQALRPVLHILDRVGQRAVCVPVLLVVAWVCRRRQRSWRPLVVAVLSVLALNFVVGVLKLSFGREEPVTGNPSFFQGGLAYPSGHSSNIVLVYGLTVYLLSAYHVIGPRLHALLWSLVALLALTMVVTSLTLHWHWFADLIAGLIIGSVVLQLTITVDAVAPDIDLSRGWWRGLTTWLAAMRAALLGRHDRVA